MSGRDRVKFDEIAQLDIAAVRPLVDSCESPAQGCPSTKEISGLVIGRLLAIKEEGHVPLVHYPGQAGSAALAAQTVVDLFESHIGKKVVLMFEAANADRPVVLGVLCEGEESPHPEEASLKIDADGERLIVSAREQLVLRCGKASITLTDAGKVLIKGTYISSRSSGMNRITGGSIQLN